MKKTLLKYAGIAALAFAVSSTASAALINGIVTIAGGATLDTNNANTATGVIAWNGAIVVSSDGDFAAAGVDFGDVVALQAPWAFSTNSTIVNFWSVGGFSFDLTSSSIAPMGQTGNGSVTVHGSGYIYGNGYEETKGTWSFTTQNNPNAQGIFSFSASVESVPDGGTTAALLGAALVGLSLLSRRRAA